MKKSFIATLLLFVSFSTVVFAQMSEREKFTESLYLMDEKRFAEALPYLRELLQSKPDNANLNYNMGVALGHSFHHEERDSALTYLAKAVKEVSPNYTPYNPREKKAPVDAWYYYGLSLHADNQFDEAIAAFVKFETYINDKHYLYNEVENRIKQANYAKRAIENPRNVEIINLGAEMNSTYPEYSPAIRIDESAIYFTSRRLRPDSSNLGLIDPNDGMYLEDIYVSYNEDGKWTAPRLLNISTTGNEATLNLSVDGKTLYTYRGEKNNGALLESKLISDSAGYEKWSKPKLLGSDINTKANESHVTISPDNKTLYFTSDREGGFGGMDVYFCRILPNGKWAEAVNAGPVVNTAFDEDGVYMHPDGKTLYFSSNGHEGMGGYDFFTTINTDSGWTTPVNLGYPINSVDDDIFFVTTPDGKRAYFSSFKKGGQGEKDIYMLELIDAEEINLTLYRGEFVDIRTGKPPRGALVSITNNYTGAPVGYYTPRDRDGQFSAILEPNSSYHFIYEADDFETYEEDIYVPEGASYQEIYKDIRLKPVRVGGDDMSGITPAALASATVNGNLTTNDTAVANQKLILTDEKGNVVYETTTDAQGGFEFTELDPSKTYMLKLDETATASFLTYDLMLKNDRDEELVYTKKDNKTAVFVPSKYPYEFYGISARELAGTVSGADGPVEGLRIRLENNQKLLVAETTTDELGKFNFQKLSLENQYRLVFDGEFPEDPEITITNEFGEELTFRRVSDGVFEYVPKSDAATAKASQIAGTFQKDGAPVSGVSVMLQDDQSNVLQQQITDDKGQFIFANLDMDKSYKIVFTGDYPTDAELILTNEFGEQLTFVRTGEGTYEYIPAGSSGTQMAGVVSAKGKGISNLNIKLTDGSAHVLQQVVTDDKGEFNFTNLNMDQKYRIIFEGDYPDDLELILMNEFGQELRFQKVGDGVYEYIPGKKSKNGSEFKGTATSNGKALSMTRVRLQNDRGETFQEAVTDSAGAFIFKHLDLNSSYVLLFDGDPDMLEVVVYNEFGQELTFVKTGEGKYEYVPSGKSKKGSVIAANVKQGNDPLSGMTVSLKDARGNLIEKQETNDQGNFRFTQLNLDREYILEFEGDYPDDAILVMTNEFGEELMFVRTGKGKYRYLPKGGSKSGTVISAVAKRGNAPVEGLTVQLKNAKGEVIDTQVTNDKGSFVFSQLNLDDRYSVYVPGDNTDDLTIVFLNEFGDELTFMEVKPGVYMYVPRPIGFPLKAYTLGVKDEVAYKDTYPQPQELKDVIAYFQKYFPYNAKDITENNNEFKSFIKDIAEVVEKRGFAQIIITSSASKVPTKTWKSNSILTKRRAYDTKRVLEKIFKSEGITEDQYNFVDINTLITGPDYKNDALKNKTTYEKHQYVRIFIK